jgi:predicted ferric reductase
MADKGAAQIHPMGSTTRRFLIVAVILTVATLLVCALTIPFLFESPSMFYKFGWKKNLLRLAKMMGLTATIFLMLQLLTAARLKWLDRILSLPDLYVLHRYSAYTIVALAVMHPITVFMPDGILMIPFETRYWPEWAGAALLLVILSQFVLSKWRPTFFDDYQKWLLSHRVMGVAAIALLLVHILYVSETFENDGPPRNLVLASAMVMSALWLWVRLQSRPFRNRALEVNAVVPAGIDAFAVDLVPIDRLPVTYLPGQFAFISFHTGQISKAPHPFTIASSPTHSVIVQITIRCCGDWTRQINTLQPGDKAYLQGPFGRFSHLFLDHHRQIIMIAGGIGITPMLSMLRYMRDVRDSRRVILIWSNQTPRHLFNKREIYDIAKELTDMTWIPIFTREKGDSGLFGRLDRKKLESLLSSYSRNAAVLLCGPPPMIKQVRSDLTRLGFSKSAIYFETFGF